MKDPFGSDRGYYNYTLLSQRLEALKSIIATRVNTTNSEVAIVKDFMEMSGSNHSESAAQLFDELEQAKLSILDESEFSHEAGAKSGHSLGADNISGDLLPSKSTTEPNDNEEDDGSSSNIPDGLKCGVCFDLLATAAVFLCGHVCCFVCAHTWMNKSETCPICRSSCGKSDLHRVFNMDSLTEMHSKFCFPGDNNPLRKIWADRKELGIKLASGESLRQTKPSWDSNHPDHGSSSHLDHFNDNAIDHDGYESGGYDNDDGQDNYHSGYFYGAGYKLGSEPSSIYVDPISPPPTIANSTIDDPLTDEEIAIQFAKKESLREARLKMIQNKMGQDLLENPSVARSPSKCITSSMSVQTGNPISVSDNEELARQQALKRVNAEQESRMLDRKRLQIEIAQDREARRANKGLLPTNHEPLLSKDPVAIPSSLLNSAIISKPSGSTAVKSSYVKSQESLDIIRANVLSAKQSASDVHAALTVVLSILKNILKNPEDTKFRSVNTSGKTFKEKISHVIGISMLFYGLGFVKSVSTVSSSSQQSHIVPASTLTVSDPDLMLFEEISNIIELYLCELSSKLAS